MNFIQRFILQFKIDLEKKKLNLLVKDFEKKVKKNPDFGYEKIDEPTRLFTIGIVEKLIKYQTKLGIDCTEAIEFLEQLKKPDSFYVDKNGKLKAK